MKVGVFETGRPPKELADHRDPYPVMFANLMAHSDLQADYISYKALDGEFPDTVTDCDAWVVMGSASGANDETDWMLKLEDFIREVASQDIPMIGICFGHQIIAKALGGKVVRAEQGWGLGIHTYDILERPEWMDQNAQTISVPAFHQDQVATLPKGARVIAKSDFSPSGMIAYDKPIITIQNHPEFAPDYAQELAQFRKGTVFPDALVDQAMQTFSTSNNSADIAKWFGNFLESNRK